MSQTPSSGAPKANGPGQQVVLVVDARPVRQFYTSIFLQRLKYQVIMAKTAEDAIQFSGLTVPLVVIANYDLPNMNGLALLKRLRHDHRTRNVPFIVYTSNRSAEVQRACEDAGCTAYLRHPCSLEELYAAVQKATQAKPRKFVRLKTMLDVVVGDEWSPGNERSDTIIALSEKGMFVSSSAPLSLGEVLPFTFYLPNAPGWFIRVDGQVLYSHLTSGKSTLPGMAVKFVKIGKQELEFVREFIKLQLMDGIAPEQSPAAPQVLRGAHEENAQRPDGPVQ